MNDIYISLTLIKPRIYYIKNTINSLLNQTMMPDKIYVYYQGNENDINKEILNMQNDIFNIIYINDKYKSYSKFIYSFKKYNDKNIILCDDDLTYTKTFVEKLYNGHLLYPNDVICNIYRRINIYNDSFCAYRKCLFSDKCRCKFLEFLSGWGTLFPKHYKLCDKINIDDFIKKCPTHDELYLLAQNILQNKYVYCHGMFEAFNINAFDNITTHRSQNDLSLKYINTEEKEYEYGKYIYHILKHNNIL